MNFLRLKRTSKIPNRQFGKDVFFVDTDGILKKISPDSVVSEIGSSGSDLLLEHKVTLESTDILALDTTPFTLVPGVPGKIIVPFYLISRLHFGTVPYSQAGGTRLFIGPTFGESGWGALLQGVLGINRSFDGALFVGMNALDNDNEPLTLLTNQPFCIDENDAVTAGDGTVDVTILYYLLIP